MTINLLFEYISKYIQIGNPNFWIAESIKHSDILIFVESPCKKVLLCHIEHAAYPIIGDPIGPVEQYITIISITCDDKYNVVDLADNCLVFDAIYNINNEQTMSQSL